MNFYLSVFVAVAVLVQTSTAGCVRTRLVSTPVCTCPILSAPVVSTTTIIKSNSVTNSLVDVLSLLPVCSLLNEKLPCYPPCALPVVSPIFPCCGCGCGCGCGCLF